MNDVVLTAEDELLLEEMLWNRIYENRIDVRINPTVFLQHLQANEVRVMGVSIFAVVPIPESVSEFGDERHWIHLNWFQVRLDQLPVFSVWLVMIIKKDFVGVIDLSARFQANKEAGMKWFRLFLQA